MVTPGAAFFVIVRVRCLNSPTKSFMCNVRPSMKICAIVNIILLHECVSFYLWSPAEFDVPRTQKSAGFCSPDAIFHDLRAPRAHSLGYSQVIIIASYFVVTIVL